MTPTTQLEFVTVDVFTSQPYEGNPLAIVRIPHGRSVSQEEKQTIAREFNLSETAFLHEKSGGAQEDAWTVDIFITTKELPFAGHPTVGTACYVLGRTAQERGVRDGVIEASFKLKAGPVGLRYDVAKRTARADIPHDVHIHKKRWTRDELFALQSRLAEAFQQSVIRAREDYPIVSIVKGMTFVLVELESLEALSLVSLASHALKFDDLDEGWSDTFVGVYFFVRTGKGKDGSTAVRTRMIEGPLEDPATGSAASDLAAYLSIVEGKASETLKYEIIQGVEMGRRSEIFLETVLSENKSISKIYLEGGSVQVMEGRLTI
ncbi:Diaminopimelate epimerase-like protein [Cucurbitaria berberidis CBS 394.84]|uniref:Diaminopimelate epimerase-like protein n=1 Tax=Cucurbitaria berberidis CBS 394.84 TaxID=1168544 RepID=A0A9P4GP31_9PLEO|nr:Diaminopimelate epimerase-like protein [Cucurbitaria berberidis CBS 394.84]KAF1848561.1 Diaminopimelate epimerase-like protein [Cucurbitaria berberidis CBS 394.84]